MFTHGGAPALEVRAGCGRQEAVLFDLRALQTAQQANSVQPTCECNVPEGLEGVKLNRAAVRAKPFHPAFSSQIRDYV